MIHHGQERYCEPVTYQVSDAEPGTRFDPEAAAACVVGALRPQADADRAAPLGAAYQNRVRVKGTIP